MDIQNADIHPLFAEYCDLLILIQNRTRQQEIQSLTVDRAHLLDGGSLDAVPSANHYPNARSKCTADVLSHIDRQIYELEKPFVLPVEDSLRISFILWLRRLGEIDDEDFEENQEDQPEL